MYCPHCGKEISSSAKFCEFCGNKIHEESEVYETVPFAEQNATAEETHETKPAEKSVIAAQKADNSEDPGPWKVFAIIGFVFGIVSLVFFWYPFECFYISPFGLVFSGLGKYGRINHSKAEGGFVMSLVATIVNFVISVIYCCAFAESGILESF